MGINEVPKHWINGLKKFKITNNMGYYINKDSKGVELPVKGKGAALITSGDAKLALPTNSFSNIPLGKALVCVVDNGAFDAVAYAYSESEFEYFKKPDGRDRIWLEMDKELAEKLSDYPTVYHDGMEYNPEHPAETLKTHESVPSAPEATKPTGGYTRIRKPKKKTKKNTFVADYRNGYAVVNGAVKEVKSKTQK